MRAGNRVPFTQGIAGLAIGRGGVEESDRERVVRLERIEISSPPCISSRPCSSPMNVAVEPARTCAYATAICSGSVRSASIAWRKWLSAPGSVSAQEPASAQLDQRPRHAHSVARSRGRESSPRAAALRGLESTPVDLELPAPEQAPAEREPCVRSRPRNSLACVEERGCCLEVPLLSGEEGARVERSRLEHGSGRVDVPRARRPASADPREASRSRSSSATDGTRCRSASSPSPASIDQPQRGTQVLPLGPKRADPGQRGDRSHALDQVPEVVAVTSAKERLPRRARPAARARTRPIVTCMK